MINTCGLGLTFSTVSFLGRSPADVYSLLIEEISSRIFLGRAAKFDYQRTFVHNIERVSNYNKRMWKRSHELMPSQIMCLGGSESLQSDDGKKKNVTRIVFLRIGTDVKTSVIYNSLSQNVCKSITRCKYVLRNKPSTRNKH